MKKLLLIIAALLLPTLALAAQVSVPSAPGLGFYLVSTTTGNYVASSTNTFNIGSLFASSTTATSTFAAGVVASAFAITGAATGCAQFYAGGQLLSTGVSCGTGSGGTQALATSTNEIANQIAYWTTTSGSPAKLSGAATTTVTCTGGTTCNPFVTIGGSPITINSSVGGGTGLSSTTPWTAGQITYVVNNSTISSAATSTLTGSGVVSISNSPIIIGASGAVATITGGSNGQVLGWLAGVPTWTASSSVAAGTGITIAVNGAVTTVTNSGVTSLGNGTGITCSGTAPGSCSLASMSAGVLGTPITGIPTSQATSTLYGVGTGGMVLGYSGGNLVPLATTTFTGSGPISLTYANGQVTGSCATCNTSNATVSSITAGLGLNGGTITTSGTVSLISYLATSTGETQGQLAYWSTTAGTPAKLTSVATSSFTTSGPWSIAGALGAFVGGVNSTLTYWGLSTTSNPVAGQLLMSNGGAGVSSTATTTATCGAGLSCTTFTILGSSPITLTASGGSGTSPFATTTSSVVGQLVIYPLNSTDILTVGGTGATTTARFTLDPNTCLDNPCTGIGTTSPWGRYSIGFHNLAPTTPAFVIASSSTGVATTTQFIITNGNVGIATSSPGSLFSINGVANFSTGTTSFYGNGIDLANGCFSVRGVCVSGSGGGSGTVTQIIAGLGLSGGTITSSGRIDLLSYLATSTNETAGQLSYWSTTSGTPAKLNSVATTTLTGNNGLTLSAGNGFLVGGSNATIGLATIAANSVLANGTGATAVPTALATSSLFSGAAGNIAFFSSANNLIGTSTIFIDPTKAVGIGTITPGATLELVATSTAATTNVFVAWSSAAVKLLSIAANGVLSLITPSPVTNAFTISTTTGTTAAPFSFDTLNGTGPIFKVSTSTGQPYFYITKDGYAVTAATSTPALTACGTSPSVTGDALHFTITVGSVSATSCTATFPNAPLPSVPHCNVSAQTIKADLGYTETNTAVVITSATLTSDVIDVNCSLSGQT